MSRNGEGGIAGISSGYHLLLTPLSGDTFQRPPSHDTCLRCVKKDLIFVGPPGIHLVDLCKGVLERHSTDGLNRALGQGLVQADRRQGDYVAVIFTK